MTDRQRIENALDDIEKALKEHARYPAYDEKELIDIDVRKAKLKAQLEQTQQEANT